MIKVLLDCKKPKLHKLDNLFEIKELATIDTATTSSKQLEINTDFKYINLYYSGATTTYFNFARINIQQFLKSTSGLLDSVRLIGQNDGILIILGRGESNILKLTFADKNVNGTDSFKYIRVELSNL